ncbi:MAG: four helix bundle protein [Candidatus Aenigmarchaeota archaeon]|nr:four helix bundle protein [Candidatus Aenigmarchaeota archaeon]
MSYTKMFQKSYDLVKWIYPTINKFPKSQRLILSQRIENTSIKILEMVIDLGYNDSKIIRKKILFEIHKLQILMRLSKDLAFLDLKKYEHVSSLLKEISDLIDKRKWIGDGNLQKFV